MKRKSSIPEEKLLPYETICAATRGDPEAMDEVLRHFDGYISHKATRIFYDEYGQSYCGVDVELKQRIQNKLIAGYMVCPLHLSGLGISCAIRQLVLNNQPAIREIGIADAT